MKGGPLFDDLDWCNWCPMGAEFAIGGAGWIIMCCLFFCNSLSFVLCRNIARRCNTCGFYAAERRHFWDTTNWAESLSVFKLSGSCQKRECPHVTFAGETDKTTFNWHGTAEVICFKRELYSSSLSTEEDYFIILESSFGKQNCGLILQCRGQYSTNV